MEAGVCPTAHPSVSPPSLLGAPIAMVTVTSGVNSFGPQSAHPQWGVFPMLQLQNWAWMVTHVCMTGWGTGLASAGQRGMFTGELIPQAVDPVPAQGGGHGVNVSLGSGEAGCASARGRVERA